MSKHRIVAAAAVALTVVGVLAGCSGRPGAAAVVDGRAIASSDVATALAELKPVYTTASVQGVLATLISEPALIEAASQHGVGVSDEDGEATLRASFASAGVDAPEAFSPATIAIGRYLAAADKVNAIDDPQPIVDEFSQRMQQQDVQVNPRFGTFEQGSVVDPVPPAWVVSSAAQ